MKEKKDPILISLTCNILLVIVKGTTGLLANSNALVADAIHSLFDVIIYFMNHQACRNCKLYSRIDKERTSERISQRIVEIETHTTYYSGILFLIIGMAICFHNFMILVLDKVKKPDFITFIVAFIIVLVYAGLHKYLHDSGNHKMEDCHIANINTHWQNRMNLVSGMIVVVGLAGTMFGFIFMDELAAIVVGSIVLSLGIKWITEASKYFNDVTERYFKFVIIGSILMGVVLGSICLCIQI